jgi:hypothetical protein
MENWAFYAAYNFLAIGCILASADSRRCQQYGALSSSTLAGIFDLGTVNVVLIARILVSGFSDIFQRLLLGPWLGLWSVDWLG